jgi:hypothetical protein
MLFHPSVRVHLTHSSPAKNLAHCFVFSLIAICGGAGAATTGAGATKSMGHIKSSASFVRLVGSFILLSAIFFHTFFMA